ncbi:MAG: TRAM domain-containing protein [Deltaproteobacteria bacterium]|nr:MAG: TRAM domain-containing protein [Deltaproteobacteria bacterium]
MYSPRPQTVSTKLYTNDVPPELKKERLGRVLTLQSEISLRKNRESIGSIEEILVEGASKLGKGQIMGRTRSNRIVNVAGPEGLIGEFVSAKIMEATANSLLGELITKASIEKTINARGIAW